MLQWQMFNINIIKISQGFDKVNYVDGEQCWSYIIILLMGFIQRNDINFEWSRNVIDMQINFV